MANCFWAAFVEGQGLYCLLCKRHNSSSAQNKSEKFSVTPSTRFKKATLKEHKTSKAHKDTVAVHETHKHSIYHKDEQEKQATRNKTVEKVMRNAYFIMKEELSITKLAKLNDLLELQGIKEMRHFEHGSQRIVAEVVQAVGEAMMRTFLEDIQKASCYGLLVDDVTDVSVKELMITFIQYIDTVGNVQTKFLFVRNLLKDSVSANAITIHDNIMEGLRSLNIDTAKFSSICTDGAAVMVGKKNGLAALLRQSLPEILNFHCVCHKLALATVDTLADETLKYINDVHEWCRQVWHMLEKSPKKMAIFIKAQVEVAECETGNDYEDKNQRKMAAVKLKKACKTRWLSFEQSVHSIKRSLHPLLLALVEMNTPIGDGLHKKMSTTKFVGTIYMLDEVLPILSRLSVTFQQGKMAFANIKGGIEKAKYDLTERLTSDSFLRDMEESQILSKLKLNLAPHTAALKSLKEKYILSLINNIEARFDTCQEVFNAFRIFDPKLLPSRVSKEFKEYGDEEINVIGQHFVSKDVDRLNAEWGHFKFDMLDLKDMEASLVLLSSSKQVYPLMSFIADVCRTAPVSNAWPERGASAIKMIKTRLRRLLKKVTFKCLLQVSINGPPVAEANDIIESAAKLWLTERNRYKIQNHKWLATSSASTQTPQGVDHKQEPENVYPQPEVNPVATDQTATESVEKHGQGQPQDLLDLLGVGDVECEKSNDEEYDSSLDSD